MISYMLNIWLPRDRRSERYSPLDEDSMNRALLMALRQRDIDVTTVSEVKREGFSDEEQLLWAGQDSRVICTY